MNNDISNIPSGQSNLIRGNYLNMKRTATKYKAIVASISLILSICGTSIATTLSASAAVSNPSASATVSFTFDDGLASALTQAAPILSSYGFSATDYVITKCVGMTTAPNSCHADTDSLYMDWGQIASLQSAYDWEIGSHTATHPYLATKDASDGQPRVLTAAQVTQELTQSKADLAAHGINATDFSSPYGDYNNAVLAQIAKYYASHRGFADQNNNIWPYSDYLINDFQVQEGVTVDQVKAKIDSAIANNQWLVLTMHDIKPNPSSNPDDYEYGVDELNQIASYVKTKQVAGLLNVKNVNQSLVNSSTNLLPNSSFNSGIAGGWTTDSATTIKKDTLNNGSYPDAANSIKMTNSSKNTHLFSPKVLVNPNTTYGLKSFLNVQKISKGQVGFYIDEYDINGKWISGQYKTGESSAFVEEMNFTYKPSSLKVSRASLQVVVTAGSGVTAYFDNAQWFALDTPPPPPAPTSLIANGTFDAGIASGWATNSPSTITADSANNGSPDNPQNSVKLVASDIDSHLFSPIVSVDPAKSYYLSCYLDIKQVTNGGIGFYIDEYDSNGNWISGQYKSWNNALGVNGIGFSYTPSSTNVKKASLQVIVEGNSGITAYIDNVLWTAN